MELMTRHVMVDMMALSCSSLGISSRLPTGTELSRVGETDTPLSTWRLSKLSTKGF